MILGHNKSIERYIKIDFIKNNMTRKFNVIIERDGEGWYVSEVVELSGCHTQGKTIDELMERTKEAIMAYLETEEEPKIQEQFVGIQQIEV